MLKKILLGIAAVIIVGAAAGYLLFKSDMKDFNNKAKVSIVKQSLKTVAIGAEMYKIEFDKYPESLDQINGFEVPKDVDLTYESDGQNFQATGRFEEIILLINQDQEITYPDGTQIK